MAMTSLRALIVLGSVIGCSACGGDDTSSPSLPGVGPDAGTTAAQADASSRKPPVQGQGAGELTARIEDPKGVALTIVTTRCDGECADIVAVAEGGRAPYSFVWQDGETAAARKFCPSTDGTFSVTASDTPQLEGEFGYAGSTARAEVFADVLTCPEPPRTDVPEVSCDREVAPLQLMTRTMSDLTSSHMNNNGALTDYELRDGLGTPLTLVREARVIVDRGSCTSLPLAGDSAGKLPTGWDNYLIVEYRAAPGGEVEKRWFYGPQSPIFHAPSGQQLSSPMAPTVSGFLLDPPVPNPLPFGYAALELDLMKELPAGAGRFELTLYVVDSGAFGSTSAVFLLPR
jgi:hypothetical protein